MIEIYYLKLNLSILIDTCPTVAKHLGESNGSVFLLYICWQSGFHILLVPKLDGSRDE